MNEPAKVVLPPAVPPVDNLTADELMTYLLAFTDAERAAYIASLSVEELDKSQAKLKAASDRLEEQMARAPKTPWWVQAVIWLSERLPRPGRPH